MVTTTAPELTATGHRSWLRRIALALAIAVLTLTVGAAATGGAGPAAANPVCDVLSIATPGTGAACDKGMDQIGGVIGNKIGEGAQSAIGGTFDKLVDSMLQGYEGILTWALTWWIKLPTPDLQTDTGLMQAVHERMLEVQVIGLTFSLMFFGMRMMIDRKRSLADDAEDGFKILFRAALAVAVIPLFITVGGQIADAFSDWLVSDAIDASDGKIIENFLNLDVLSDSSLGTAAIGILAFVGFLGGVLQLIFLVVRQAMLMLVVAALPVAASFSGTGPGSQTYQRLIGWSVAFLLFKPVGALVYFIAFKGAALQESDQQVVLCMVLMGLCAFVLPSLMRLVAPAIGTMGAGGSGAAGIGAVAGAAVAAGTLAATGGASGGGGAASTGSSPIAGRSGQQTTGQISSSSNSSGGDGNSPASTPPSVKPGAQPALSGAGGDSTGSSGGPTQALSGAGEAGAAVSGGSDSVGSAVGDEAEIGGPPISMQPNMQSGYGENAMTH